ncbi:MAG TPA: glycosyltransferase family 4 protein [Terriglobales bacterium]|nr:glycosyltransferase family 4 protein [Terriglobales bacterium]
MHVLMTADTIGGVWTYTRELVTQLSRNGIRVTLVSFGEIPTSAQSEWLEDLSDVSLHPTAFRLEWMQDAQGDLEQSAALLKDIIGEIKPDVLHFNQFHYGNIDCDLPRIVVAHSDVVSWWVAVHGTEPPDNEWIRTYRENVVRGLAGADIVVAPSQWMLQEARRHYGEPQETAVVYNGRDHRLFMPYEAKEPFAISVGRLWDAGKQATLLLQSDLPLETILIGSEQSPAGAVASAQSAGQVPRLKMKGPQTEGQLRQLFSRAAMYIATSRYEPFGLAPVEAALSRCAIVANDIPSLREVWDDDALYFERNNPQSLLLAIQQLASNSSQLGEYADRAFERARNQYTSERMAEEYLKLYRSLVAVEVATA